MERKVASDYPQELLDLFHEYQHDTIPRYDEEAAKLVWSRTLEFFNKHLR
jgi:dienelactone hydrolase